MLLYFCGDVFASVKSVSVDLHKLVLASLKLSVGICELYMVELISAKSYLQVSNCQLIFASCY